MPDSREKPRHLWLRSVRIPKEAAQEADRRAGELLTALLDERGRAEVDGWLARGEYIYAVRRARELTGARLIDAKRMVDSLRS